MTIMTSLLKGEFMEFKVKTKGRLRHAGVVMVTEIQPVECYSDNYD